MRRATIATMLILAGCAPALDQEYPTEPLELAADRSPEDVGRGTRIAFRVIDRPTANLIGLWRFSTPYFGVAFGPTGGKADFTATREYVTEIMSADVRHGLLSRNYRIVNGRAPVSLTVQLVGIRVRLRNPSMWYNLAYYIGWGEVALNVVARNAGETLET